MQWQVNPRGDVPLANSSRWPYLRGGADACFDSRYAACACGKNPRRGPPAALPEADVHRRCLVRWRAFPCVARHAAMDDQIFASLWLRKKKTCRSSRSRSFSFAHASGIGSGWVPWRCLICSWMCPEAPHQAAPAIRLPVYRMMSGSPLNFLTPFFCGELPPSR